MKKLRAHALFFVLVISLIIAILCGSVLLLAYYNSLLSATNVRKIDLVTNAHSGMELLLASPPGFVNEEVKEMDLYGEGNDTVSLQQKPWGLYHVFVSRARCAGEVVSKVAMVGYEVDGNDGTALYMVDNNRPLRITGTTRLEGDCYLPKEGVERAYLEGLSYTGTKMVYGKIKRSTNRLPEIDSEIRKACDYRNVQGDSKPFGEILPGDTVNHSFLNETLVLTGGDISIDDQHITGNVIILASRSVTVQKSANLIDVLIYSPTVKIDDGFTGSLQIVASDSVVVGAHCRFNYPSSIGLIKPPDNRGLAYVKVGRSTHFDGSIFTTQTHYDRARTQITLLEESVINGFLYGDGKVQLKGTVNGTVWGRLFTYHSTSTNEDNLLVSTTISRRGLSADFVSSIWLNNGKDLKVAKWLR